MQQSYSVRGHLPDGNWPLGRCERVPIEALEQARRGPYWDMDRDEELDIREAYYASRRPTLATPNCPRCGQPPKLELDDDKAFCGNDDCDVFCWDPNRTREQFEAEVTELRLDVFEDWER